MTEIRTSLTVVDKPSKELADELPKLWMVRRMVKRLRDHPHVLEAVQLIIGQGFRWADLWEAANAFKALNCTDVWRPVDLEALAEVLKEDRV